MALSKIFASISEIPSVGEKTQEALLRLGIKEVKDFLFHFPSKTILKLLNPNLRDLKGSEQIISKVIIEAISPPAKFSRRHPFKIVCSNETGFINLVYFNYKPNYLLKNLKIGDEKIISGKVERYGSELNMAHPEFIVSVSGENEVADYSVTYPLTYGIVSKQIEKYASFAIDQITFEDWHDDEFLRSKNWNSFKKSVYEIHNARDLSKIGKFKERLAYDELLANQIALSLIRKSRQKSNGNAVEFTGEKAKTLLAKLGFKLTNGQAQVLKEIELDQKNPTRMMRLLQGDVGSGKTLVALVFALNAVEFKMQTAFMAPTDILAQQHYEFMQENCKSIANIGLLTGKIKGKKRKLLLEELESGKIDILVGTHALFQDNVIFKNLGAVVIDEQHRFGVMQRENLAKKGNNPDILLMSATPIPRSLTMTHFGDMDVSILSEKPAGRMPIETRVMPISKVDEIVRSLKKLIDAGEKIYWICPLIEEPEEDEGKETEKLDLAAAKERFENLEQFFPSQVGLVHGKMKPNQKNKVMEEFVSSNLKILVATTVIEVGVNVPDATIMIIEQAERFGLSQLHQLRGRVGRGSKASNCLLLYGKQTGKVGMQRMKIMKESNDGFHIAEKDLELRGGGDVLGTQQSGLMSFKIANFTDDFAQSKKLLYEAKEHANLILSNGLGLSNKDLNLLRIFNHEVRNNAKI